MLVQIDVWLGARAGCQVESVTPEQLRRLRVQGTGKRVMNSQPEVDNTDNTGHGGNMPQQLT